MDYSVEFSISSFPCASQCHLQREGLLGQDTLLTGKFCSSPQTLTITVPLCCMCVRALEAAVVGAVWLMCSVLFWC